MRKEFPHTTSKKTWPGTTYPLPPEMEEVARNCRAVCWGSLAQRNDVSRKTIAKFLKATPKDCIKIFDINLRQNFYTEGLLLESFKQCNILKINDEELVTIGRLFGYPGLDMTNKCWLILGKYNLDALILTCGVNGSLRVYTWSDVVFRNTKGKTLPTPLALATLSLAVSVQPISVDSPLAKPTDWPLKPVLTCVHKMVLCPPFPNIS